MFPDSQIARHCSGLKLLKRLCLDNFQHLLTDKEKDEVGRELLKYAVDHNLGSVSEQSVVQWWAKVSERKCYPALCKIASTGLSIFHGPAVLTLLEMLLIIRQPAWK